MKCIIEGNGIKGMTHFYSIFSTLSAFHLFINTPV